MILTEKILAELLAEHDAATTPEARAKWHTKTEAIITSMSESDSLMSIAAIGRLLETLKKDILEAKNRIAIAA